MTTRISDNPFRHWGMWGVMFGGLALVLVFVQIVGPSFEPKPSVGQQVGEIAGEIKRSAWRTFLGLPKPETPVVSASVWDYLALITPVLGVLAIVLSLVSAVRRENWRYPAYALGLGTSAIVFQFVWWVVLVVVGVMLLVAVMENLGDIFSF